MMLKIVSKPHSLHVLETHLRNKNKEDFVESTGVVPAKYPPKVKLESFHKFKVSKLGEIMCTLVYEGFRIFIVV